MGLDVTYGLRCHMAFDVSWCSIYDGVDVTWSSMLVAYFVLGGAGAAIVGNTDGIFESLG